MPTIEPSVKICISIFGN